MKDFYQAFLNYSFWLLARKAYSSAEILKKLKLRAKKIKLPDSERDQVIARVIARLCELGYINDDKIIENFLDYGLTSKPVGKFYFLQKMKEKGILGDKAKTAWASREIDEYKLAEELLQSQSRKFTGLDLQKRKKKAANLLAARGFSADIIWRIIGQIDTNRPSLSEASSGGCRAKRARPKQLMRPKDASLN